MRTLLVLILAVALVAAACGADSVGDNTDSESTTTVQSGEENDAERGGFSGDIFDLGDPIDASGAVENPSTTPPHIEGALAGDDGVGPLPLGTVTELPGEDYLNFLFEFCQPECYRDAHFMDPNNPQLGSGPWTSGRPFHVRHGFVNNSEEPLGEGFDVVFYITRWEADATDSDGFEIGQTYEFASDFVFRGTSDQCGPTYKTQTGPETCEWFVHDFPDGLPDGRYDLWAVWEAPCSAWSDLGFTETCGDATEIVSMLSSGVNSPFGSFPPSFTEANEAQLTPQELTELYSGPSGPMRLPEADASGSASTGGTPLPDFDGAVAGDGAEGPLPLGVVSELPGEDRLDFLFEFCGGGCFRDAHFMDPNNPELGSGPWTSGRPFHIRHGFINNGEEPLGERFDVVIYVTPLEGFSGSTTRYTSDYVLRGVSDQCGPTYKTQTGPETCEWFVHDFPDGLPDGRFAIWAVWEAPCSAWANMRFTDTCADPDEVTSMFSSGFDSPFGSFPPSYTERNEA